MNPNYLDFEQPIADLDSKIDELRHLSTESGINIAEEVARLQAKSKALTEKIFSDLSVWQKAQIARHPKRPYTLDYVNNLIDGFDELHGDRLFGDDQALIGGIGEFRGRPVMVIGHEKGRTVKEKVTRNFGMPRPEGYRKGQRLMQMAERFRMPVLTFIDTPGAYPGIDAEERGQSEAIAKSLAVMARLRTPIVTSVIGEGGSGGALAIGVCDKLLMLEFSTYSVISLQRAVPRFSGRVRRTRLKRPRQWVSLQIGCFHLAWWISWSVNHSAAHIVALNTQQRP